MNWQQVKNSVNVIKQNQLSALLVLGNKADIIAKKYHDYGDSFVSTLLTVQVNNP